MNYYELSQRVYVVAITYQFLTCRSNRMSNTTKKLFVAITPDVTDVFWCSDSNQSNKIK